MTDFAEQRSADSWSITNDGVMGGKSEGHIILYQDKCIFTGNISLENNGGFSSAFRTIKPLPKKIDTVTIDVKGDGLTYQLRIIVNIKGYRLDYKHSFNTVADKRETMTFALADFQATFRGRMLTNAPVLQSEDIYQAGFLVNRKVAGSFSLSVFKLNFT